MGLRSCSILDGRGFWSDIAAAGPPSKGSRGYLPGPARYLFITEAQRGRLVANYEPEGAVLEEAPIAEDGALRRVTELLARAARPKYIILFGSQARGDASEDSDFDVMVVEPEIANRGEEMVRLGRLLRSLNVAVDLLVVSAEKFEYWRDTPGNVYFEAASEGRILYEAA
jgi:predicted nucleotidyltransferase